MIYVFPIDISEKWLAHYLLRVGRAAAESHIGLTSQQLLENGNGIARHMDRIQRFISENGVIDLVFILATEG
jgi:hypothetical protein